MASIPNRAVLVTSDGNTIVRVSRSDESVAELTINSKVSQLTAGFDYNRNGIADLAIRKSDGTYHLLLDPMTGLTEANLDFPVVARKKGFPIAGNFDGAGDAIGYLYRLRKDREDSFGVSLMLKRIDGSIIKTNLKRVRARNYRNIMPLAGPDGVDRLLFVWNGSSKVNFELRAINGKREYRGEMSADGKELNIGNYFSAAGEEFAIRTSAGVSIVNPFDLSQKFVEFSGDGVVSDHVLLSNNSNAWSGEASSGIGLSAVCGSIKSVSRGVLWKPASQDSGGSRQGKPVALFQDGNAPRLSSIKIYASNGEQVTVFGVFQSGSYERYYSGYGAGEGLTASQIASTASSKSGSSKVYMQGPGSVCFGPIEPTKRTGALY